MQTNLSVNEPFTDKLNYSYKDSKYNPIKVEDIINLEKRIEKALKNQAEDISLDISELEKQIKTVNSKFTKTNADYVTHQELEQLEQYLVKKIDSGFHHGKLSFYISFGVGELEFNLILIKKRS